jgi:hypothetical protein
MAAAMEDLMQGKEIGVDIVHWADGSKAIELRIHPGYEKRRDVYVNLTAKDAVQLASHLLSHAARLMKNDRLTE